MNLAQVRRRAAPWLGAAALVLGFSALAFPWQHFAPAAFEALAAATGVRVATQEVATSFGWRGPLVVVRGVVVTLPDGRQIPLDEARLRPALSFDWLRGRPVAYVELDAPFGSWRGALGTHRIAGKLEQGKLAALPLGAIQTPWSGLTSLDLGVTRAADDTWQGEIVIASENGGLTPPGLPIGVPYDHFEGRLALGEGGAARVEGFEFDGPMFGAQGEGALGQLQPDPAAAQLDLEVDLVLRDQSLRPLIAEAGLALGPEGKARLHVRGSPANPQVEIAQ